MQTLETCSTVYVWHIEFLPYRIFHTLHKMLRKTFTKVKCAACEWDLEEKQKSHANCKPLWLWEMSPWSSSGRAVWLPFLSACLLTWWGGHAWSKELSRQADAECLQWSSFVPPLLFVCFWDRFSKTYAIQLASSTLDICLPLPPECWD